MEPIRVLQVVGLMGRGGAESMIMNLYRAIDRTKIQFDFVVHTKEEQAFDQEILALGGRIYRVPSYKVYNHLAYRRAWRDFLKNHGEYRVVHSHIRSTASIFLPIAKEFGLVTVVHSHNTSSGAGLANGVKNLLQRNLKREGSADYRLACGQEAGRWLFGDLDFQVLANAIHTDDFVFSPEIRGKIRSQYGVEDCFVMGNVARFHPQKNHLFLLEVFAEIYHRNPNARLMLVGDGDLRAEITQKISALKLEDGVILTGVQPNVNELLMAMDVFLFPSLWEGLPVTMIEAQATGLHCVASRDNVTAEVAVTDLVEFVPLEAGAVHWAERALGCGYERKDMRDQITDAGYDIEATATWIQEFYLKLGENRG